ncbi:hypothetical protein SCALM49S_09073 [Streptomyces californicus]
MVDGVRDGDPAVREHGEALRFAEPGLVRAAVAQSALPGAEVAPYGLAVRVQLDQAVTGGVGDQNAAVRQQQRLAGEAQVGGDRLGRDVGAVAPAQRPLGPVLVLQLLDELLDGVRVALARVLGDDIALGVDHDERRPGADRVLLPCGQFGIVEDGVVDLVALDGVDDGLVLGLVDELRRVDPDDHHGVAVLLLQLAQLVQNMQTVHAAERPEIEDDDTSSQVSEGVLLVACIQPAALADEFGGADACTCCHVTSQHPDRLRAFRRGPGEPVPHETSRA